MRREKLYLADIVQATKEIQKFLVGVTKESFLENDLLRSAVLNKLTIIGEAAARLEKDFKAAHPDVPWQEIVAFRNIAVHAYFAVNWSIVWTAATKNTPVLQHKVAEILAREFP
jgi:uncharacterized protein with HEPN domain